MNNEQQMSSSGIVVRGNLGVVLPDGFHQRSDTVQVCNRWVHLEEAAAELAFGERVLPSLCNPSEAHTERTPFRYRTTVAPPMAEGSSSTQPPTAACSPRGDIIAATRQRGERGNAQRSTWQYWSTIFTISTSPLEHASHSAVLRLGPCAFGSTMFTSTSAESLIYAHTKNDSRE